MRPGEGRRGLHGLGGRGLPRRARHSFPLNWAPGPAPLPRPARIALGGLAPGGERRPAGGGGCGGGGDEGAGSKAWGGPFPSLRCSWELTEASAAWEGRDRFARLRGGGPEPSESHHCGVSDSPRPPPHSFAQGLRLSLHTSPRVVTLGLLTALGSEGQAHCRGTLATG